MNFGKPAHIYVDIPKPIPASVYGPPQKASPEPVLVPVKKKADG